MDGFDRAAGSAAAAAGTGGASGNPAAAVPGLPGAGPAADPAGTLAAVDEGRRGPAAAAGSRRFRVEPGVAERAARVCADSADELHALLGDIADLGDRVGFGECRVGEQLSTAFARKATAGPESLHALVATAERIVHGLGQTYRDAGSGYARLDDAGAQALRARS